MAVFAAKVAVTDFAASIVTWHVPVPMQAPLQPEKTDPDAGVAVSVTAVLVVKLNAQLDPQSMPAGADVTVPDPAPAFATVSAKVFAGATPNAAVTLFAASIVTSQAPVPEHAPLHPENTDPGAARAVSATAVPSA
jgi:hypothetical protein